MYQRLINLGLVVAALWVSDVAQAARPIDFTLPDVQTGKPVSLADYKQAKVVVVAFIGTACPINNAYAPTLVKLAKKYESKGVQFIGVNPNRIDSIKDIADHQRKYEISFPVLKDSVNKVSDLLGARRTPEVVVLDEKRAIRYRGRIDDQFDYNSRRNQPTKNDLADAIEAVLNGKPVAVTETEVRGCLITRATKPKDDATITFTKDVERIIQKNCQECHRPGQIGPMPLMTFDQVEGWSAMIQEVVSSKRMPPWYADPKIGHFANDRSLPKKDRETLLSWIDAGCPKGDPKDAPPARQFESKWQIGTPDLILKMPKPYDVAAEMPKYGIPYQYFIIETNFKEDMWVERAEARPDAKEVVHHIIAFVVPPRNSTETEPPGPPLLPPFVPESKKATVLCGTAPGDMPTVLPPGYAKKIPKGALIVLQMHYTPNGRAQKDQSSIGLIFAKKPPTHRVLTVPIMNFRFAIPPGEANHEVESWGPWNSKNGKHEFEFEAQLISFMPHMHLRGKDFLIELIKPDGKSQPLLLVPNFNFNWQTMFQLGKPIDVAKGSKLHCVAHFDNSEENPSNPDPKKTVRWGDQTWQEMMIGWTDIAIKRK